MEFLQEHLWGIVATISTALLGILSVKYADKYAHAKEFLAVLLEGLEDGTLTPDEIQALVAIGKKIIGKE